MVDTRYAKLNAKWTCKAPAKLSPMGWRSGETSQITPGHLYEYKKQRSFRHPNQHVSCFWRAGVRLNIEAPFLVCNRGGKAAHLWICGDRPSLFLQVSNLLVTVFFSLTRGCNIFGGLNRLLRDAFLLIAILEISNVSIYWDCRFNST